MEERATPQPDAACSAASQSTPSALTTDELAQLSDPVKQEQFRLEYLAQLRRRACPGCGETGEDF